MRSLLHRRRNSFQLMNRIDSPHPTEDQMVESRSQKTEFKNNLEQLPQEKLRATGLRQRSHSLDQHSQTQEQEDVGLPGELQNLERRPVQIDPGTRFSPTCLRIVTSSFMQKKRLYQSILYSRWFSFYYRLSFPQKTHVFVFFIKWQVKKHLRVVRKQSDCTKQE